MTVIYKYVNQSSIDLLMELAAGDQDSPDPAAMHGIDNGGTMPPSSLSCTCMVTLGSGDFGLSICTNNVSAFLKAKQPPTSRGASPCRSCNVTVLCKQALLMRHRINFRDICLTGGATDISRDSKAAQSVESRTSVSTW